MGTSIRSISRSFVWLICLLLVVSPGVGMPLPVASQGITSGVLDFAAVTLTPRDLRDAGLDDFRVDSGHLMYFDEAVAIVAEDTGLPEDEVADQLSEVGYTYWYQCDLILPADEDPAAIPVREVYSYVAEFADEDQAAVAWELLQDESGNPTAEDLPDAKAFGDRSEATMYVTGDPATGQDLPVLDIAFLVDNLMLGVRLFQRDGTEPDLGEGEALAGILEDRVDDVLNEGGPGLSRQALRLEGDQVVPSVDNYVLLDGNAIQFYYEDRLESRQRATESADVGETDEYTVWQQLAALGEGQVDDVWYMLRIRRFDRAQDASSWLANVPAEIGNDTGYAEFQIDERATSFGDESLSFTMNWADGPIAYRGVAIRIGVVVATIYLQGPEAPPADAIEDLAVAQVRCMEDGCEGPMPVPRSLEAYIDGLGGVVPPQAQAVVSTSASAPSRWRVPS